MPDSESILARVKDKYPGVDDGHLPDFMNSIPKTMEYLLDRGHSHVLGDGHNSMYGRFLMLMVSSEDKKLQSFAVFHPPRHGQKNFTVMYRGVVVQSVMNDDQLLAFTRHFLRDPAPSTKHAAGEKYAGTGLSFR